MQERRKALKSGGPQRLNRVDLYGKSLISMENPSSYTYAGISLLGFCNIGMILLKSFLK